MDLAEDTIRKESWFSGKRFGNQFDLFSPILVNDTPRVYKFSFFSMEEKELSSILFDIDQNVVRAIGLPLYTAYNMRSLKKDSIFELICFWGTTPPLTFQLQVEEIDNDGRAIRRHFVSQNNKNFETFEFANKIVFSKKYSLKGKYSWKIMLVISDRNLRQIIKDSSIIDLTVE